LLLFSLLERIFARCLSLPANELLAQVYGEFYW